MKNLVLKATQFAIEKHHGQVRRGDGRPYVTHPLAVSYIVATYKRSKHLDEILAASLLHDTLEDTDTNFVELATEFTPLVASLVHELTSDETLIQKMGKLEYMKTKMSGISSYALVIKLADRLHNISDSPTKKMVKDTREILKHLEETRSLTRTHKMLITEMRSIMGEE